MQAKKIKPDFTDAHYSLANTRQAQGRLDQAEVNFRQTIALDPACAEVHSYLGKALLRKGHHQEGLTEQAIGSGTITFDLKHGYSIS